jgi:hypothetical protein
MSNKEDIGNSIVRKFVSVIRFLRKKYFFLFLYQKLSPVYKGVYRLHGESTECQYITKRLKNFGTCMLVIMTQKAVILQQLN